MKLRQFSGLVHFAAWVVGLAYLVKRHFAGPQPMLSRAEKKQRRKKLIEEARKARGLPPTRTVA